MTNNTATALISGGTSGISLATAEKLVQLGIYILVVGAKCGAREEGSRRNSHYGRQSRFYSLRVSRRRQRT
jgi:NAD(P)-dependent dehydrogenase (short-subunit alcohol dehydrogenase family)